MSETDNNFKFKAKRENFNVSIRRKKNDKIFMSKRVKFMVQNDPDFGCISQNILDQETTDSCFTLLEEQINQIINETSYLNIGVDFISLTHKMKQIRCLISKNDVISSEVAEIFQRTNFMKLCKNLMASYHKNLEDLQQETSWVVANICAVNEKELVPFVFSLDTINSMLTCLSETTNSYVFENLLLAFANMVQDDEDVRNTLAEKNILRILRESINKNDFWNSENHIDQIYYLINFCRNYVKVLEKLEYQHYEEILVWAIIAQKYCYQDLRPMALSTIRSVIFLADDDDQDRLFNYSGIQESILDLCKSDFNEEADLAILILSDMTVTNRYDIIDKMVISGAVEIFSKSYKDANKHHNLIESCLMALNNQLITQEEEILHRILKEDLAINVLFNCSDFLHPKTDKIIQRSTIFVNNVFSIFKRENLIQFFEKNENSIELVLRQLTQNQGDVVGLMNCLDILKDIQLLTKFDENGENIFKKFIAESEYAKFIEGLEKHSNPELSRKAQEIQEMYLNYDEM